MNFPSCGAFVNTFTLVGALMSFAHWQFNVLFTLGLAVWSIELEIEENRNGILQNGKFPYCNHTTQRYQSMEANGQQQPEQVLNGFSASGTETETVSTCSTCSRAHVTQVCAVFSVCMCVCVNGGDVDVVGGASTWLSAIALLAAYLPHHLSRLPAASAHL